MNAFLENLSVWLEGTAASLAIRDTQGIVPLLQSIHIFAVALVIWGAVAVDLRLLGIFGRQQPLIAVSQRFTPVIWWTLIVLLITGVVLIVGEPQRTLQNAVFQFKMVMLLIGLLITAALQYFIATDTLPLVPKAGDIPAKALAVISLGAWVCIIFAGRWIAYS